MRKLLGIAVIVIFVLALPSCQPADISDTDIIDAIDIADIAEAENIPPVKEVLSETETQPEAETEIKSEIETATEAGAEAETETETEAKPETAQHTEPVTQPPPDPSAPPVRTSGFPILIYHTNLEEEPDGLAYLYVKPSEFEKQIRYLADNNYTFCTFDDWDNLQSIEKPVFITFDDGYAANYHEIFPILKRYDAKMTIFLVTRTGRCITRDMVREMSDSGLVKFESHTITHPNLEEISADAERLAGELRDSKAAIEEITGKPVAAIAYPGGRHNDKVIETAREFYRFGATTISEMHSTDIDDFRIRRITVERETTMDEFIKMVNP